MKQLNFYRNYIVKQDFINKFTVSTSQTRLQFCFVEISIPFRQLKLINYLSSILALEYIFCQKASISISKKPNIILSLKKGVPVGCKLTLRGSRKYFFLENFLLKGTLFSESVALITVAEPKKCYVNIEFPVSKLFSGIYFDYRFFGNLSSKVNLAFCFSGTNKVEHIDFLFKSLKYKL